MRTINFSLTIDDSSSTSSTKSPLEEATWQLEYTQEQNAVLDSQLNATLEERSDLQEQVDDLEGHVAMLQEALKDQQKENADQQSRFGRLRQQLTRVSQEAHKARRENADLQARVDELTSQVGKQVDVLFTKELQGLGLIES